MGPIGRKKFQLANPTGAALSVTYPENRRETKFQDFLNICRYISQTVIRSKWSWTNFLQRILRGFDWCVYFYCSSKIVGDIEFFPPIFFQKNRPSLKKKKKDFFPERGGNNHQSRVKEDRICEREKKTDCNYLKRRSRY